MYTPLSFIAILKLFLSEMSFPDKKNKDANGYQNNFKSHELLTIYMLYSTCIPKKEQHIKSIQ